MALLSDRNFEQDIRSGISVVKFYSLWSMDCRALEQPFKELSDEFRGKAKFIVSDINENHVLAKKEGITRVPAVAIYINGTSVAKITDLTKRRLREYIEHFVKRSEV